MGRMLLALVGGAVIGMIVYILAGIAGDTRGQLLLRCDYVNVRMAAWNVLQPMPFSADPDAAQWLDQKQAWLDTSGPAMSWCSRNALQLYIDDLRAEVNARKDMLR